MTLYSKNNQHLLISTVFVDSCQSIFMETNLTESGNSIRVPLIIHYVANVLLSLYAA